MMRHQRSGFAKRQKKKVKDNRRLAAIQNVPVLDRFFIKTAPAASTSRGDASASTVLQGERLASQPGVGRDDEDDGPLQEDRSEGEEEGCEEEEDVCEATLSHEMTPPPCDEKEDVNHPTQPMPVHLPTDPALWGELSEWKKDLAIANGPATYHNRADKYVASKRNDGMKTRCLTNDLLQCQLPNKQSVSRDWMVYSPSTGMVYCFACKCLDCIVILLSKCALYWLV